MAVFAGLLRAVNVSGSGKLIMRELVALCEDAGFTDVSTYIQSGNVVFKTRLSEAKARAKLEQALSLTLKTDAMAVLRSADELEGLLDNNPFKQEPPERVMVMFMDDPVCAKVVASVVSPDGEKLRSAGRDLYIHFPNGMGRSKLRLPFAKQGTARNLNTVLKLATMARKLAS